MFAFTVANLPLLQAPSQRIADDQRAMSVRQGDLWVRGDGRANRPVPEVRREGAISCPTAPTSAGCPRFLLEPFAHGAGCARSGRDCCLGCRGAAGPKAAAPWDRSLLRIAPACPGATGHRLAARQ